MIGIVVVTHGRVAEELVDAARNIVGEIPAIAAVSDRLERRPGRGEGRRSSAGISGVGGTALVLTDMFGGTPTNLSLPFLSGGWRSSPASTCRW